MGKINGVIAGIIVVLVGAGVFAAAITYTSTPRFCSSCHIMETRYVSWQNSDHGDYTSCLSCHAEPGATGEIKAHLAGSRYLYSFIRGQVSRPILLAEVPNKNCYKCHEQARLKEKPAAGEVHDTYHRIHLSKELNCVECHGGLAHATMVPVRSRSVMSLCGRCHQRRSAAFAECALCHPTGPAGPAFLKVGRERESGKILKVSK